MEHDPDFNFPSNPLDTAFDAGSEISSLPDSIDYQAEFEEPRALSDPAKLAMIQSAQALLADAEQKLVRFQKKKVYASAAARLLKLEELHAAVIDAQHWLSTLINS
jgi:hypothetical protein